MKLELKHLEPYLMHDLNVQLNVVSENTPNNGIRLLYGLKKPLNVRPIIELSCLGRYVMNHYLEEFKPILRPLSEIYTDKCEVDFEGYESIILDHNLNSELPYRIYQLLFENHLDVFGLIEKGLAIDVNTLKP